MNVFKTLSIIRALLFIRFVDVCPRVRMRLCASDEQRQKVEIMLRQYTHKWDGQYDTSQKNSSKLYVHECHKLIILDKWTLQTTEKKSANSDSSNNSLTPLIEFFFWAFMWVWICVWVGGFGSCSIVSASPSLCAHHLLSPLLLPVMCFASRIVLAAVRFNFKSDIRQCFRSDFNFLKWFRGVFFIKFDCLWIHSATACSTSPQTHTRTHPRIIYEMPLCSLALLLH